MNPNRQNNCFTGRLGGRPPVVVPAGVVGTAPCSSQPCGSAVVYNSNQACGNDAAAGGIILGTGIQECDKETVLSGLPIAMAYVPWQGYGNIYPLQQALQNGTMFRELDLDFAGRRCN